jgi:FkbM family methyltransferase
MWLQRVGGLWAFLFGWPGLKRINTGLLYLCCRALGLMNYTSDRISGEKLVIKRCLEGIDAPVVFDVGANEGDWLTAVLASHPRAVVHAFEPQAALAAKIASRQPAARINNAAVGDRLGELALYDYADHPGSQHASLLQGVIETVHGGATRSVKVAVVTLDDYCSQRGIERIDLLKIDVEGFELNVLRGASRLLDGKRINAIQFEFNEMNVIGRTFLNDFMTRLEPTHAVFRVLPHGLMPLVLNRHWINEQFAYQNIVALKR